MGKFVNLYRGGIGCSGGSTKVRRDRTNHAVLVGDRYKKTSDGGFIHRSFHLNTANGVYREYCVSGDNYYGKQKK